MITDALSSLDAAALWIWTASWQAAVIAGLVLLIQWVFRRQLSARWRNAFWLLVFARLLLPVLPQMPCSVYNYLPGKDARNAAAIREAGGSRPSLPAGPLRAESSGSQRQTEPMCLPSALSLGWGIGFIGILGFGMAGFRRHHRRAVRLQCETPAFLRDMFETLKKELGVGNVRLISSEAVETPGVSGCLRPVVLLPARFESKLGIDDLRMILLHELTHVKRGDLWAAWIVWLIQALHWFNPVIHFATSRARKDREMACDEQVIERVSDRNAYGSALIRFLESNPAALPQFVGIFDGKSSLLDRVRRIAAYRRPSILGALIGATAMAVVGGLTLTAAVDSPAAEPQASRPSLNGTPDAGPKFETYSVIMEVPEAALAPWLEAGRPLHFMKPLLTNTPAAPAAMAFSTSEADSIMEKLVKTKGVTGVPWHCTVKPGRKTKIEVGREFKYPTEYAPPGKGETVPTPTAFDVKPLGPSIEYYQKILPGDEIDLSLTAEIIDLTQIIHYSDQGTQTYPIDTQKEFCKRPEESIAQAEKIRANIHSGYWQPVFSTSSVQTQTRLFSGQTLIVGGPMNPSEKSEPGKSHRFLLVFVTSKIVPGTPVAVSSGSP